MFFIFLILQSAHSISYTPEALADQITNLPGAPANVPFNQFGGYLLANDSAGKQIFYWFVESQSNPETDPLILWTNGGPGCSGLLGFMTEHGPFRPQPDGSLATNLYSWNRIANIFYIESPAGVGFSYSATDEYRTGDDQTARENYNVILSFLERYPHYNNAPFYLTSESYGGHYLPTLSKYIIDQNNSPGTTKINFKGFALGNPWTDPYANNLGNAGTLWGHQVIPKYLFDQFQQFCLEPIDVQKCLPVEKAMFEAKGQLNIYALDYPLCTLPESPAALGKPQGYWTRLVMLASQGMISETELKLRLRDYNERLARSTAGEAEVRANLDAGDYDPCVDNYATAYLNRLDVQTAIHAKSPPFGNWSMCSDVIALLYKQADSRNKMEPYYQYFLSAGTSDQRFMVFSGDNDNNCATMGTQYWIYDLGYNISSPWTEWLSSYGLPANQITVGGYVTKFDIPAGQPKFSFVTVHGAGHEVPTYKPALAFELFEAFLNDTWF